jgi:hypothetical protein
MGISDEDYAREIELLKKLSIKERKIVEQTLEEIESLKVQQPYGHFKVLTEEDLAHDGMKAPLSALVDMWVVRWSSKWVSESEFKEDAFWRIAFIRLSGADMLEKHHLANQFEAVYRVIE